jgi:non-heme Fe2+,alpha-ketoglutarate-dependent halogenase
MDMNPVLNFMKTAGFAKAGQIALTAQEVAELKALAERAFASVRSGGGGADKHPDYIPPKSGVEGVMRIPQQHPRIAALLDKLVCDPDVRTVLEGALGPVYKIWQANFRRSVPGDLGLNLHQDGYGETNICILLTTNETGSGATVFAPGSHLVPQTLKQWRSEAPPFVVNRLKFLFTSATGVLGDVAFFFNRTWHARLANPSSQPYDVILISFFPANAAFGFDGYGEWSPDFLASIRGTRLGELIDPAVGAELQANGLYKVLGQTGGGEPFALAIEKGMVPRNGAGGFNLLLTTVLMRVIVGWIRPIGSFFKHLLFRTKQ